jgi:hypothetical protein
LRRRELVSVATSVGGAINVFGSLIRYTRFENSPHLATTLDTRKEPERHGYEACRGLGKEHVEGGGGKTKIFSLKDISEGQISALLRLPPARRRTCKL